MILQNSVYLKITKNENNEYKISSGRALDFIADRNIIVNEKNPNVIWNLLYDLAGIPLPVHVDPKAVIREYLKQEALKKPPENEPSESQLPQKEMSDIEKELSALSSREIVSKVFNEKGIQITNSLKSKVAILKKALKIYEK